MRLITNFSKIGCLILSLFLAVFSSAAAEKTLNTTAVTKIVRDAKIFEPNAKIDVYFNGKEIIVQSYLNPKANDNDCKIDAVLIAKAIFDAYPPPAFSNIRVNLFETKDETERKYRSVIVRAGDIEVFAKGAISRDALLASLTVAHDLVPPPPPQPSPRAVLELPIAGPYRKRERQNLLNNIRDLQSKNQELGRNVADVDKCCTLFLVGEAAVRRADGRGFVRAYNETVLAVNQEQAKINRVIGELYHKPPVAGPQYARRVKVFGALEYLEQHGKDVTELRRIFEKDIEPLAKTGQNSQELDVSLTTVERALSSKF
jgi:hypothetical protein